LHRNRIDAVDALRGMALTGVLLVHVEEFYELNVGPTSGSTLLHAIIISTLSGKAFALLALCFGFSFHAWSTKWASRPKDFRDWSVTRYIVLAMIGWLHGLLYRGDILTPLALIGILLIPTRGVRSPLVLLVIAIICLSQPYLLWHLGAGSIYPAYQNIPNLNASDVAMHVYLTGSLSDVLRVNLWTGQIHKWYFLLESGRGLQMMGLALIGCLLGRSEYFSIKQDNLSADLFLGRLALLIIPFVAVLRFYLHFPTAGLSGRSLPFRYLAIGWSDLSLTLAYLAIFTATWRSGFRRFVAIFAPLGRTSLSFYIAQSIVMIPLFYPFGLGWFHKLGEGGAAALGLAACIAQIGIAMIIQHHFRYGPFEWLWRSCTETIMGFYDQMRRRLPAGPAVVVP
jgi:uncharacterized protein